MEALEAEYRTKRRMLALEYKLDRKEIEGKEDEMVDPKVQALITQFDAATDAIAARITRLIANSGVNAETEAALNAEVAKLTALGKDPENPVPVVA